MSKYQKVNNIFLQYRPLNLKFIRNIYDDLINLIVTHFIIILVENY
jgi:hypothetical protein